MGDRQFQEITNVTVNITQDEVRVKNPSIDSKSFSAKDLPSEGRFYPKDFTVNYRLYSFGELKTITPKSLDENDPVTIKEYFDLCLKGITFNKEMNKYDLCYHDFIYISIVRKFPSIVKNPDEPFEISSRCPSCGNLNMSELNLDNIEFKELSKDTNLTIKTETETLNFKPITIGRYLELLDFRLNNKNLTNDILIIACCLQNDKTLQENYDYIYNLEDRKILQQLVDIEENLKLDLLPYELTCVHCEENYYINLATNSIEFNLSFPLIEESGKARYHKSLLGLVKRLSKEYNISPLDAQYMSLNDILLFLENSNEHDN